MDWISNSFAGAVAGVALCASYCTAAEWGTDLDQALAVAAKDNRPVLVEFTGSDWCHWCMVLREKVLNTPEFEAFVAEKGLLLVELDYPSTPGKATSEQMAVREQVLRKYDVKGFPTVLLTDAKGQPFAMLAGSAEGPRQYTGRIQAALDAKAQYDAALAAADRLEGVERAQALVKALELLPPECRLLQADVLEDIMRNDAEDVTGIRKARELATRLKEQRKMLSEFVEKARDRDEEAHLRKAGELLKREDLLPPIRMAIYIHVSNYYVARQDLAKTLEYLKAAVEVAPESREAKNLQPWINTLEKKLAEQKAAEQKASE